MGIAYEIELKLVGYIKSSSSIGHEMSAIKSSLSLEHKIKLLGQFGGSVGGSVVEVRDGEYAHTYTLCIHAYSSPHTYA